MAYVIGGNSYRGRKAFLVAGFVLPAPWIYPLGNPMAIIISKNGKNAVRVEKSSFDKEDFLQQYIYENPESIPLYDIKEDIQLLILAREFPTHSGPIDALGIDKDGEIYIVETKLFRNPDKRTVIAQALDYGAALWKHSGDFSQFIASLDMAVSKTFDTTLIAKLREFFELSEEEVAMLLENVRQNLSEGAFRFVVLMDQLDDRLKDLVIYVNQNSQFDVYAVEFEYYKHETQEIIIPKIFGAEVKKEMAVSSSNSQRKKWTEEELLSFAKRELSSDAFAGFNKIFSFSKQYADSVSLGTGTTRGSFGPVFEKICPRTIFTLRTNGLLSLNFAWLNRSETAEIFRSKYFERMKEVGFQLEDADIERYPTFQPDEWLPRVEKFLSVISEMLEGAAS